MRKFFIPLVLMLMLAVASCQQKGKVQTTELKNPLENLVDSYMKAHPEYLNNDITKEEGDKYFQKIIVDTTKNYLAGIPLTLRTINKNGNSYIGQFYSWHNISGYNFKAPVENLYCDVVAIIPDSLVRTLKEDENYVLKGNVIERMANIEVMETILGKNTIAITNEFGIRKDNIYSDKYEVNLGLLFFNLEGISLYNGHRR